jgi:hypothetical protein
VIEESLYWRLDLQRYARMIDAWRRKRLRRDIDWARVERSIMLGFFSIRRLLESYKLSDDTRDLSVQVTQFPFKQGSHLTLLNWSKLDRHYDLAKARDSQLALRELSNQVIHSYVFSLASNSRHRLAGVFVSSEFRRRRSVAYLPAWRIVRLFRRVAADWPDAMDMRWDERFGDFRVSARRSRAP